MRTVFADTGYWAALLNPHDQLHPRATEVSQSLQQARCVTTEMVLTELLTLVTNKRPSSLFRVCSWPTVLGGSPLTPQDFSRSGHRSGKRTPSSTAPATCLTCCGGSKATNPRESGELVPRIEPHKTSKSREKEQPCQS